MCGWWCFSPSVTDQNINQCLAHFEQNGLSMTLSFSGTQNVVLAQEYAVPPGATCKS